MTQLTDRKESRTANSTCNKLAIQWLNEVLCPHKADSVLADPPRRMLRNRQLIAENVMRHSKTTMQKNK